jgi:hypothetical protein
MQDETQVVKFMREVEGPSFIFIDFNVAVLAPLLS